MFERQCQALAEVMQQLRESHERKFDEVLSLEQMRLDTDLRLLHNRAQLTPRGCLFGASGRNPKRGS